MLFALIHIIDHYGLAGIFGSMLIENLGIPLPTEGGFLVAQRYISTGAYSFWFMYFFIVLAHMIGALVAYWIGYQSREVTDHKFTRGEKFKEAQSKLGQWYDNYGSVIVLAARLIGYVRPWSSLVAGYAEFPLGPFILWTLIGNLLFVYPTMKATALLIVLWNRFPAAHVLISVVMLLSFCGFLILAHFRPGKSSSGEQTNDPVK